MFVTMLMAGAFAIVTLNACTVADIYPLSVKNQDAEKDKFLKFATKCYRQTSKTSRLLQGAIFISERSVTPDGNLLVMEAASSYYNCRLNSDGSVAVSPVAKMTPDVAADAA